MDVPDNEIVEWHVKQCPFYSVRLEESETLKDLHRWLLKNNIDTKCRLKLTKATWNLTEKQLNNGNLYANRGCIRSPQCPCSECNPYRIKPVCRDERMIFEIQFIRNDAFIEHIKMNPPTRTPNPRGDFIEWIVCKKLENDEILIKIALLVPDVETNYNWLKKYLLQN